MLKKLKTCSIGAGGLLLALTLSACGSLSKVSDQGASDQPVWPDTKNASFDTGSYPNVQNLRMVSPGMTKDQLYNLLGRPHFAEGLIGVREWDYLFHFRTVSGDMTCQYKVLFDKDKIAQSFYWQPQACASVLAGPAAKTASKTISLNSDVLFAFGSATLTAAGQADVARAARTLQESEAEKVEVVGHTDFIGSETSNMTLSQRRAQAVRDELLRHGVPADRLSARGAGESQPVVQCGEGVRSELITCLAPNRRVDITAV